MPIRSNPLVRFKKRIRSIFSSIASGAKHSFSVKPTDKTARIAAQARKEKDEFHKKRERIADLRRRVLERKKVVQIKKHQKVERKRYNKKRFAQNLIKAGIDSSPEDAARLILYSSIALTVLAVIVSFYYFMQDALFTWVFGSFMLVMFVSLGFGLAYGLVWLAYHQYLDMAIYRRRKEVEDVLADFLLLTSANVRAGMTIDSALWNAVRPRFGVIAREIENVAKRTLSGEDLNAALYDFAESYNSPLLKRSISLLVEGLTAGGEIASLLNDIALNIQETQIMRKEMASNVTTYAIFINFATLFAAPVLFALAGELLKVVRDLSSRISLDPNEVQGGFAFSGGSSLTYPDYLTFALITLSMTTIFSTIIVASIKKGNAREAIGSIPVSMLITLSLFFLASYVLGGFLGDLI
jgi:Flp pilus assembly protein TadB